MGLYVHERRASRELPALTDTLGNSLNDRLLFAIPKSQSLLQITYGDKTDIFAQRVAFTHQYLSFSRAPTYNSTATHDSILR
jgi:hypothetical protein